MGLTWDCFVAACNMLGSDRVDFSRLAVTGLSMGGQACWNIARHCGPFLAAAAPVAACCSWNDDAWVDNGDEIESSPRLEGYALPIRSYCGESDIYSYSWNDFRYFASSRGLPTTPD